MRAILLVTALVALSPAAFAQTGPGTMGGTPPPNAPGSASMMRSGTAPSTMAGRTVGENCGTPDEPKPCPPLPRHPLPSYPASRQ
ncbi:MAG TPA: hypothetical protein VFE12_13330 [Acetobacteraceae bacterium]|jgi:hypothetical protein|nr:hypothetical protein [Acetobacteraceae bacterium]